MKKSSLLPAPIRRSLKRTLQWALRTRAWRKCIACPSCLGHSSDIAEQRVEFARKSLEVRPAKEDYRDIRYSDEWHISVGSRLGRSGFSGSLARDTTRIASTRGQRLSRKSRSSTPISRLL